MSGKWLHTIRRLFTHRAAVLMYHRIADVVVDPWQLAVSPAHFEQQVQVLQKKHNVISVAELIENLQQKKMVDNAVCITFDDGYGDNYLFAKPILEKYHCPATFFIPSHYIGQRQPFWWDNLEALILTTPQLPQLFQLSMPDDTLEFDLGIEALLTNELAAKHKSWTWPAEAPTRRSRLYLAIWERLKPLPHDELQTAMTAIKSWANHSPAFPETALPMNREQLQELSRQPLFRIGLHTATHPALAHHPEDVQYHEIAENKKALQSYHPVNAVAFPYGAYNNSTLSALQNQHLDAGFTTEAKPVMKSANPFCLGRFQVTNQDGTAFEKQLTQWLSV